MFRYPFAWSAAIASSPSRDRDVDFRLRAPRGARVDAVLLDGNLIALSVEPPAARDRIVLPDWAGDRKSLMRV